MPIRSYKAVKAGRCPYCKDGFDITQSSKNAEIEECPKCGTPVARIREEVNSPKILRPISSREAKSVGFEVLKRNKHGLYEKE